MSKAFTRESDDMPERPETPRKASPLPPGIPNYITPDGAKRLRDRLEALLGNPKAASFATEIQALRQSLAQVVIAQPSPASENAVRFGSTVTVRENDGAICTYRIVGVEETDLDRGWISWLSPIAKALVNSQPGQVVRIKLPRGEESLEIISVSQAPPEDSASAS